MLCRVRTVLLTRGGVRRSAISLFSLFVSLLTTTSAVEAAGRPFRRPIRLADIPPSARSLLASPVTEAAFEELVRGIDRQTAQRERAGEYEHLAYYLLQSSRFTHEPRVEPALAASELVQRLSTEERTGYLEHEGFVPARGRFPDRVIRRLEAFVAALQGHPSDARLAHFRDFLAVMGTSPEGLERQLLPELARSLRFLYRKEFLSRELKDPQSLEAHIASLYEERGHSTDTQVEANFAVHTALAVIRAQGGHGPLDNVLIVGPGLDFAPRTDLVDVFDPQSYQPFAVADALLGLGLSSPDRLHVHCVDINARVVAYLQGLSQDKPTRLQLLSGVPEHEGRPFTADYREYFEGLGSRIGAGVPLSLPAALAKHLAKAVLVRAEIARKITVDRLNIITERYGPAPSYDLVVVTNVFSYFDPAEQVLALANIDAMLRPGGYFVHNEPQTSLVSTAQVLGLPLIHARTVMIAGGGEASLFDRVVIHQKKTERPASRSRRDREQGGTSGFTPGVPEDRTVPMQVNEEGA